MLVASAGTASDGSSSRLAPINGLGVNAAAAPAATPRNTSRLDQAFIVSAFPIVSSFFACLFGRCISQRNCMQSCFHGCKTRRGVYMYGYGFARKKIKEIVVRLRF